MRLVSADDIAAALSYPALTEALREAFGGGDITVPERHYHALPHAGTLLVMPAWTSTPGFVGTKLITVFPDNLKIGRPSVDGSYLLASGETGEPLAILDAQALTAWRTAAVSALAASFLAREDATHLLMIGAGALAPHLVRAHAAMRPIARVTLWNRTLARAEALATRLAREAFTVDVTQDLETAVRAADVVSAATISTRALVEGRWLKPGVHVDLVGAFAPQLREADEEAILRARVYVDSRAGAARSGDLAGLLADGLLRPYELGGDLCELCAGLVAGRNGAAEITVFKSAGTGIADLAAAILVWRHLMPASAPPTGVDILATALTKA
jgi:ornithine cyclodeaminase/alanine dehydrogenase-like protein (mu-crystallin family)